MHRLFVAIRPPAAIRAILLGAMGGISGARWQDEDQLHLTLRFIGEVDRHRADDVHAALGAVHQAPFEIALSGIGAGGRMATNRRCMGGLYRQSRESGIEPDPGIRRRGVLSLPVFLELDPKPTDIPC